MKRTYHEVGTKARRTPKGWPMPTHKRSWTEAEAEEMTKVFALDEEDRRWDELAHRAEEQARLDMGLCL